MGSLDEGADVIAFVMYANTETCSVVGLAMRDISASSLMDRSTRGGEENMSSSAGRARLAAEGGDESMGSSRSESASESGISITPSLPCGLLRRGVVAGDLLRLGEVARLAGDFSRGLVLFGELAVSLRGLPRGDARPADVFLCIS